MYRSKLALGALSFGLATVSQAGLITHEYKSISSLGDINRTDYVSSWDQIDSDLASQELNEFTNHRSGNRRINHLSVDLSFNSGSALFSFEAGLDAGLGAAFLLNGNQVAQRSDDLWWRYDWSNSDVVRANNLELNGGANTLDIYWGEWCCNGGSAMRFSLNDSEWMDLTADNIQTSTSALDVPEPAVITMLAIGIVGLTALRRRSDKSNKGMNSVI